MYHLSRKTYTIHKKVNFRIGFIATESQSWAASDGWCNFTAKQFDGKKSANQRTLYASGLMFIQCHGLKKICNQICVKVEFAHLRLAAGRDRDDEQFAARMSPVWYRGWEPEITGPSSGRSANGISLFWRILFQDNEKSIMWKLKSPSSLPLMRNLSVWVEFTSIQPWKCLVGLIHKLLCCRNFACLFRKRGPGKYTSNGGPLRVTEVALNSLPIVSNWMDVFTGNPLHGNFVQACFDSYRTGENHATCTPCLFITKK